MYDRYGEAGVKAASRMDMEVINSQLKFTTLEFFFEFFFFFLKWQDFDDPFDLFESFFEGMGGVESMGADKKRRPVRGDNKSCKIILNFKEAIFGVIKDILITRYENCETCAGSGSKPGTNSTECSTCRGQGEIISRTRTPFGVIQQVSTCNTCRGCGEIFTPCDWCGGDGRVWRTKSINLNIPAGVNFDSHLRARSEGDAGKRGGPPGDLYVSFEVGSDPVLKRDGNNILYTCTVSYLQAILGTTIKIPTVDGDVDLEIPEGSQPDSTLVMAKRGAPLLGKSDERGDQLVRVQVQIPKSLNSEEIELIQQLSNLHDDSKRPLMIGD